MVAKQRQFEGPPVIAGSLIGVRRFRVRDDDRLLPIASSVSAWVQGRNYAHCHYRGDRDHKVAMRDCTCGFYAYYRRRHTVNYLKYDGTHNVLALIKGYGRITAGSHGFRAAQAEILCLIIPPGSKKPYQGVAERYNIPLYRTTWNATRDFPLTHHKDLPQPNHN